MAFQIHLPTVIDRAAAAEDSTLETLRAQRITLDARLTNGCDFLAELAQRVGQDSPEYDRYFAEWERLNAEYKQLCDRIDILELASKLTDSIPGRDSRSDISAEKMPISHGGSR